MCGLGSKASFRVLPFPTCSLEPDPSHPDSLNPLTYAPSPEAHSLAQPLCSAHGLDPPIPRSSQTHSHRRPGDPTRPSGALRVRHRLSTLQTEATAQKGSASASALSPARNRSQLTGRYPLPALPMLQCLESIRSCLVPWSCDVRQPLLSNPEQHRTFLPHSPPFCLFLRD